MSPLLNSEEDPIPDFQILYLRFRLLMQEVNGVMGIPGQYLLYEIGDLLC